MKKFFIFLLKNLALMGGFFTGLGTVADFDERFEKELASIIGGKNE
jgi:hypothetical protein